jgi:NDP-sugar pyrophosphorylase family protein
MMIFVPMAGTGDRYIRAGFTAPKPLILVDGVPMIERVLDAFPRDAKFLFGVNRVHATTTELVPTLMRLRPRAKIVVMDPHKDGPIQSVLSCAHEIPDDEDVCLNYCDFGVDWSFDAFRAWLDRGGWDGAMTAYKGFHPHSLGPTLYAYMRNEGDRVVEVREKHHFTEDKLAEFASSGLYWFRHGRDLKRIARELITRGERVNNEFYVSMAMQLMLEQGGRVGVYELTHFYQWGTPEDLRDYESWARAMRDLDGFFERTKRTRSRATHVIPMAGRGQRFVDEGYHDPKPLIDVAGAPMLERVIECLPAPSERVLVAQRDHIRHPKFVALEKKLTSTRIVPLDAMTEGQACTALLGVEAPIDLEAPVLFASCDAGYTYDVDAYAAREAANDADLIAFTARGHLPAIWRPVMYGWVHVDGTNIRAVAVKRLVEGIAAEAQEVITGTFWFRSAKLFVEETQSMMRDDDRVNGEFYIDTIVRRMVARGARVEAFTVDKYVPWGTPAELKTFTYWNDVHRQGRPLQ